ncbi:MAG: hypothetical protein U0528_17650 [Anaerolineae bacterium]|nr:hypothetical protein [Anaerolineae bacterium]
MTTSTSSPMTSGANTTVYPLDAEHGGIRLLLPLLSIGGFFLVFLLVSSLNLPNAAEYIGCLAFALGVAAAVGIAFAADRLLKRIWPSRRELVLDEQIVALHDKRTPANDRTLRLGERINALAWRFTVKRGSARVQRGWTMLGMQLMQDERTLTLYTFMPPKQAEALTLYRAFVALAARSDINDGKLSLRETAAQKRLLTAEDERWREGGEIDRAHFQQLLDQLQPHVADWYQPQ